MDYNPVIGSNLRKIMTAKGISAKDLASKTGISSTHLSYVVNNKRRPSFELLNGLADALGVTLAELVKNNVASQEPPVYDGPRSSPEEDFAIAAEDSAGYSDGWTEEELKDIERFKEILRMKRGLKKD